jgi:DNA-binding CsgD family transcriptional regulator
MLRHDVRTWPWWYRPAALRLARFCVERGIAPDHWRKLLHSANPGDVPLADLLRARDLTERQIEIVRLWLADPQRSRPALARMLGIGESSVRAHLNAVRRKLGCDRRRGAAALRERIEAIAGSYRVG